MSSILNYFFAFTFFMFFSCGLDVDTSINQVNSDELLDFIDDVVDELGTRTEVEYVQNIIKEGSSADRQLEKYAETGDLKDVVDMLIKETMIGC